MNDRSLCVGGGGRSSKVALHDQDGKGVLLGETRPWGRLALYFHQKADTPCCTAEACSFPVEHQGLAETMATVVGVSADDVESQRRVAWNDRLPFQLLSDGRAELQRRFGVPNTPRLLDGRVIDVIDAQEVIHHVVNSQLRARQYIEEALRLVRSHFGSASTTPSEVSDRPGSGSAA
jgi:peroxiredoxin Q/BCP